MTQCPSGLCGRSRRALIEFADVLDDRGGVGELQASFLDDGHDLHQKFFLAVEIAQPGIAVIPSLDLEGHSDTDRVRADVFKMDLRIASDDLILISKVMTNLLENVIESRLRRIHSQSQRLPEQIDSVTSSQIRNHHVGQL